MDNRVRTEILGLLDGKLSAGETERLLRFMERDVVQREEEGTNTFFKNLAQEMRREMKDLAKLIMDFKKDFASRIQPGISEVRAKYLPQAADQLEGIIESTEQAANRIMDNLESMERHLEEAKAVLSQAGEALAGRLEEKAIGHAKGRLQECLALVGDSFEQMSFQDLTGQRIKRTIDLVNLMEERLRKTLLSFGIRIAEKSRNPGISGDELEDTVEKRLTDLSGPQRSGEGLNQADIDKLLATM